MLEEDVLSKLAKGDADAGLVNHCIHSLGGAGIVTAARPSSAVFFKAHEICQSTRVIDRNKNAGLIDKPLACGESFLNSI